MIYTVENQKSGSTVKVIARNATVAKSQACRIWGIRATYFAMVACLKAVKLIG